MVVTLEAMTVPPLIGPPCRLFQDNEGRIYKIAEDGAWGTIVLTVSWPGLARPPTSLSVSAPRVVDGRPSPAMTRE
jgi:hypothetical protein